MKSTISAPAKQTTGSSDVKCISSTRHEWSRAACGKTSGAAWKGVRLCFS
jgi:hypothetical protein